MKTATLPAVMTPTILLLLLLAAAVTFVGVTGKKVPLLSSVRVDIVLLVLLGMAVCMQGGIGRVAAAGAWAHPLAILGYLLGGVILLIALAVFAGWKLPLIHTEQQALLAIALLAGAKVVDSVLHVLMTRG